MSLGASSLLITKQLYALRLRLQTSRPHLSSCPHGIRTHSFQGPGALGHVSSSCFLSVATAHQAHLSFAADLVWIQLPSCTFSSLTLSSCSEVLPFGLIPLCSSLLSSL